MPSSYADSFAPIVHTLIEVAPRTVIDIGCGWGMYGLACRQWLPSLRHLDAIEVTEGLLPTQTAIYDHVIVADALHVPVHTWVDYDLALLIDVIEHMPKADGHTFIEAILAGGCSLIVSTPKIWIEQHDDHNPFETHVCLWTWEDFADYDVAKDMSTIDAIIYLLAP